jgi:hypothetical protein
MTGADGGRGILWLGEFVFQGGLLAGARSQARRRRPGRAEAQARGGLLLGRWDQDI